MNNNHNHQPCDFSETLVSYIYGETSPAESDKFKAHLAGCGECAAELAGFGVVRSGIAEWRTGEFAPISAPAIELPARSEPVFAVPALAANSWLDGIRAFFTPRMTLAAAGFAALVICAGLAIAVLNSPGSGDKNTVAVNNKPVENAKPVSNAENNPGIKEKEEVAKVPSVTVKDNGGEGSKPAVKTQTPVREYVSTAVAGNHVNLNTPKQKDGSKQAQKQKNDLDTIYEDTEDDSLRLADLFAEADTN
jgi:hypothetical protein